MIQVWRRLRSCARVFDQDLTAKPVQGLPAATVTAKTVTKATVIDRRLGFGDRRLGSR